MLLDMLRLVTLSRERTIDLLDFSRPTQSKGFRPSARFSAVVATTLNTISGGTNIVATGKETCFVNIWHEAMYGSITLSCI